MGATGMISILLIIANIIVSYRGFNNTAFFERYKFQVEKITLNRDYKRLITSGFLHVNWMHLIFNMFSLYFFSGTVQALLGDAQVFIIYFGSLLAGNLFSLVVHRRDGYYSVVGASGAVCGLIFATIAVTPSAGMQIFFIPMPVWVYGLIFVAASIYGIRSRSNNVGHESHLAGALAGMVLALAFNPSALVANWPYILVVGLPCAAFIYIIINRPHLLLVDNLFYKNTNYNYTVDNRYNLEKVDKQKEVDRILDKINRHGMKSLTAKERQNLKEYSKIIQ